MIWVMRSSLCLRMMTSGWPIGHTGKMVCSTRALPLPSLQATLLRYHSQLHEAFVHAQRVELQLESSTRVHRQKFALHTVGYI